MVFTNEHYYNIEQQIVKYVSQCPRKLTLSQILDLPAVERILENSFGEVSKESRQVYHHIRIALENKRHLYPIVTTYFIRKLPEQYFFKKIHGVGVVTLFDVIMKHSFELPINRRIYTQNSFLFECEVDSVVYEVFRKLQGYNEKIRNSVFFHKQVLKCPLNQCIKNWKFLHVLIKMYKFSFDEEWKKQYKRVVNKIVPASFRDVAFIENFEFLGSDDESDASDNHTDDESDQHSHESNIPHHAYNKGEQQPVPIINNELSGYTRVNIRGDGNCLFNSISYYLFNTQDQHMHVRKCAVDYIRTHPDEFSSIDPSIDVEQYVQNQSWGDGVIISALSKCFRINITIYLQSQRCFIDAASVPEFDNNIAYLYYTGDHFDLLHKPSEGQTFSPSVRDVLTWNGLRQYLLYYENYQIPSKNMCAYMMNYCFFKQLMDLYNAVNEHARDVNLRDECTLIIRRIEKKMQQN